MTLKVNSAEGGTTGTGATTGNTGGGSGSAFSAVTPGAGGSIAFSNAQAAHGALSYLLTPAAAAACTLLLTDGGSSTNFTARFYVRLTGLPSAETIFADVQTVAGATVCRLHLTATGALKMVNSAGGTVATFTNTLSLNTWYRVVIFGTVNATTGTMNAALYAADSLTAIETKNQTGVNTGSTAAGRFGLGKNTSAPSMAPFYIDDIAADMSSATEIGPITNVAPTVTADVPIQNVAASAAVALSFTASDPDGSIASRATAYDFPSSGGPSISGGTTATPSFTAGTPAPKLYQVRHTVTDNDGATSSAVAEVRVPTSGDVKPISGLAAVYPGSLWTNVGGAADEGAALNDASDSTYVESPALTSTATEMRVRLDPATTRANLSVTFRVAQDTAGTIVAKGRIYQGNTMLQEWTLPTTTSPADQVCALSAGTIAAITDWGNLYAAVVGSA